MSVAGFCRAARDRFRALCVVLWANRTKTAGYLGVAGAVVKMGIEGGQHWPMLLLGVTVALIGHYNDSQAR